MELKITNFVNNATAKDYQASVAEIGNNAGKVTWQAAIDDFQEYTLITSPTIRESVIEHFGAYGAWNDLNKWPLAELNALLIQEVSAQMREREGMTPEEIETAMEDGQISSNLFKGDDGEYYFYLGM